MPIRKRGASAGILVLALLFLPASTLVAQQVGDRAFSVPNEHPLFLPDSGPRVCYDAGHHSFHSLEGSYYSFGKLLRSDGFRTTSVDGPFEETTLTECEVLVSVNALAGSTAEEVLPRNPSAFTREEISFLIEWLKDGGSLLLVMDHNPFPGAAAALAEKLGAVPFNGVVGSGFYGEVDDQALQEAAELVDLTSTEMLEAIVAPGSLGDHPIIRGGQDANQPVRSVGTFGGSAFFPSEKMQPLLQVAPEAYGKVGGVRGVDADVMPRYSMNGWLMAGAREIGEGRVVVLSEAAMCTAQLTGPEEDFPRGMNHPIAVDNPLFCLNVIRWLAGAL